MKGFIAGAIALAGCAHALPGTVWEDMQDRVGDRHSYMRFDGDGVLELADEQGGRWTSEGALRWVAHGDQVTIERTGDPIQLRRDGDALFYKDAKATDPNAAWARRVKIGWGAPATPATGASWCYRVQCDDEPADVQCAPSQAECERARGRDDLMQCFGATRVQGPTACAPR